MIQIRNIISLRMQSSSMSIFSSSSMIIIRRFTRVSFASIYIRVAFVVESRTRIYSLSSSSHASYVQLNIGYISISVFWSFDFIPYILVYIVRYSNFYRYINRYVDVVRNIVSNWNYVSMGGALFLNRKNLGLVSNMFSFSSLKT